MALEAGWVSICGKETFEAYHMICLASDMRVKAGVRNHVSAPIDLRKGLSRMSAYQRICQIIGQLASIGGHIEEVRT